MAPIDIVVAALLIAGAALLIYRLVKKKPRPGGCASCKGCDFTKAQGITTDCPGYGDGKVQQPRRRKTST